MEGRILEKDFRKGKVLSLEKKNDA